MATTILENGTSNRELTATSNSIIIAAAHNGHSVSGSQIVLNYNTTDRINLKIRKNDIYNYSSINSGKLIIKTISNLLYKFYLTEETSLESNNYNNKISESVTTDGVSHELDFTKILFKNEDEYVYVAVRSYLDKTTIYTPNSSKPFRVCLNIVSCEQGLVNQKYISKTIGRTIDYEVNIRNGQGFFYKRLVSLGGILMPLNLNIVYNGLDVNISRFEGMPYGWKTNYHQKVTYSNGSYTFTDSKGICHIFNKATNANNVYFDIAGTGLYLTVKDDDSIEISDGYDNYLEFKSNGYLSKIKKVINTKQIETLITYESNSNRISKIKDGMNREITFTYGTNQIVISGAGFKDITLKIQDNKLIEVLECYNRRNYYTYNGYLLETATSDNGEQLKITYDVFSRISKLEESIIKSNEKIFDFKEFSYKHLTTIIENKKGVTWQYMFNEEGEYIGANEMCENTNGTLSPIIKHAFETYSPVIIKDKYFSYLDKTIYNQELSLSFQNAVGNITMESGKTYVLSFSYIVSSGYLSGHSENIKLVVIQDSNNVLEIQLDSSANYKKQIAVAFESISSNVPIIKLVHQYHNGQATFSNIKIYKAQKNEMYVCMNKPCANTGWGINGTGYSWQQLNKNTSFSYKDSSNATKTIQKPMYYEDFYENQKNCKINTLTHHIWYNKKRGMVANAKDVLLITSVGSYSLLEFCIGKVYVTKNLKYWQHIDYNPQSSNSSLLRLEYESILKDGVLKSMYKSIYRGFLLNNIKGFNNEMYFYTRDEYGNLLTEKINTTSGIYQKNYTYLDYKFLQTEENIYNYSPSITTYTFDENTGNILKITQPNSMVLDFTYDENTNELIKISTTDNSTLNTNNIYYDKDNIDMLLSGNSGYKFSYDYNLLSKVQFSNAGLVSSFIDYTNTIGNSFDENTEVYANGYANDFKYDKYGRLIFCRLRNNNTNLTNNSLRFIYSDKEANQLTGYETDDELKMYSNSSSKLRMVKDENNNRRKYVYNDNGLLSSIVSESMNDTSLINYEYDEMDRLSTKNIMVHELTSGAPTIEETYTYRDDVTSMNDLSFVEVNVSGNYSNSPYNFTYTQSIEVDKLERATKKTLGFGDNWIVASLSYGKNYQNNVSHPLPSFLSFTKENYSGTESIGSFTYNYDSMDRITNVTNTIFNASNNITYQYDLLGRLVRENNQKLNVSKVWTYDRHGNILTRQEGVYTTGEFVPILTYTYGYSSLNNSLTSYNGQTVSSDSIGNVTSYLGNNLEWTGRLLTKYTKNDGTSYTYGYNGFGERVSKYVSSTNNIKYFYDGYKMISEHHVNGTDEFDITYIYTGNEIVGLIYKNISYCFVKNLQGDIIQLLDSDNNVAAIYNYDAYGKCTVYDNCGFIDNNATSIGNINPIRYRGYYYDVETGLFMVGHRYYNPEWGRWLSPDDIEYLDPQSINGLNLYAYCNNDPVNKYDPTGHFAITISALIWGIVIGAGLGAGIGLGATAIKDLENGALFDGDVSFLSYLGNFVGGAIAGAGVGVCTVLGAGYGVAIASKSSLYVGAKMIGGIAVGGLKMSGLAAFGVGAASAFVAGGVGYFARTAISDQEKFELSDMFIEAGANMVSGMLSFVGSFAGGTIGINTPGQVNFKNFLLNQFLQSASGIYLLKFAFSRLKQTLVEAY